MFQLLAGFCQPEAKTNSPVVELAFEKLESWLLRNELKAKKHITRSYSGFWCAEKLKTYYES